MKHLLLGLVICLQAAYCFGQITLEKKYAAGERLRIAKSYAQHLLDVKGRFGKKSF